MLFQRRFWAPRWLNQFYHQVTGIQVNPGTVDPGPLLCEPISIRALRSFSSPVFGELKRIIPDDVEEDDDDITENVEEDDDDD